MRSGFPLLVLYLWAGVSVLLVILGYGFAGSIHAMFCVPIEYGAEALVPWFLGWLFIVAPFAILIWRQVKRV